RLLQQILIPLATHGINGLLQQLAVHEGQCAIETDALAPRFIGMIAGGQHVVAEHRAPLLPNIPYGGVSQQTERRISRVCAEPCTAEKLIVSKKLTVGRRRACPGNAKGQETIQPGVSVARMM